MRKVIKKCGERKKKERKIFSNRYNRSQTNETKQSARTCIFVRDTGNEEGENIVEGDTFKNCWSGFLDTNGHEWGRIEKGR